MNAMQRKLLRTAVSALAVTSMAGCSLFTSDVTVREIKPVSSDLSHDPLYDGAVSAIKERDYARALDYLQAARAKNANDIRVLNALGVVYDKLGRFDLSTRYYSQARTSDPQSPIVAENSTYSKILQGLASPGAPKFASLEQVPATLGTLATAAPAANTVASPLVVGSEVPGKVAAVPPQAAEITIAANQTSPAIVMPSNIHGIIAAVPPVIRSDRNLVAAYREPQSIFVNAVSSRKVVTEPNSTQKIVTIGHPFTIVNAAGPADRVEFVRQRLAKLGWSVRPTEQARAQSVSTLYFSGQNSTAARAMQRTLPFPVRMVSNGMGADLKLVVGQDYLTWKPQNARLSALWQKKTAVAMLSKNIVKGNR